MQLDTSTTRGYQETRKGDHKTVGIKTEGRKPSTDSRQRAIYFTQKDDEAFEYAVFLEEHGIVLQDLFKAMLLQIKDGEFLIETRPHIRLVTAHQESSQIMKKLAALESLLQNVHQRIETGVVLQSTDDQEGERGRKELVSEAEAAERLKRMRQNTAAW